jgi:hypothetical protein
LQEVELQRELLLRIQTPRRLQQQALLAFELVLFLQEQLCGIGVKLAGCRGF